MSGSNQRAPISVTVIIEGTAEEVLADVERLRGGIKSAQLEVKLPRRQARYCGSYDLPRIEAGRTDKAYEVLEMLHRQANVSNETDQRLADLIERFAELTK